MAEARGFHAESGKQGNHEEDNHALADANRACQSMWDCYEFGCGVDHGTFEAGGEGGDACAECAADADADADAAKLDLRQLDRTVAGLRARQAA